MSLAARTAAFTRDVLASLWGGYDLDGGEIQELALKHKLIVAVKFDPEKHTDQLGGVEPGDDWFVAVEGLAALSQHKNADHG